MTKPIDPKDFKEVKKRIAKEEARNEREYRKHYRFDEKEGKWKKKYGGGTPDLKPLQSPPSTDN